MNVVVLMPDLFDATGGIQTFNRALLWSLDKIAQERGWTVNALVLNDRGNSALVPRYVSPERVRYTGFARRRAQFVSGALLAARRADAVIFGHVHFAPLLFPMRLVRPGLKTYLAVYGIEAWQRLSFSRRAAASRVDRILSISAATAARMQEENGLRAERFGLMPCTLDPLYARNGHARRTRQDLGLPQGAMLLSVARLDASERYKRIDLVIEAMPAVLREVPDAFYVVVGDGSDRERLEALAVERGVRDRVHFAGRVTDEDLPSYYEACDLFVLPSLQEGFGIVFLEAMHYGKPCVGAMAGGVEEVVEEGRTGLLIHPDDAEGLARCLVCVLTSESLRTSMGAAGRMRLEERFLPHAFRDRLEAALCS